MKYQIRACKESFLFNTGIHVEETTDEEADFFALYEKDERGFFMWVSDHKTRKEAEVEMQKYQPLKYWKVSYIDINNLPYVATFKTREQARGSRKFLNKWMKVNSYVYRCSLQEVDGVFIEVAVKVR